MQSHSNKTVQKIYFELLLSNEIDKKVTTGSHFHSIIHYHKLISSYAKLLSLKVESCGQKFGML